MQRKHYITKAEQGSLLQKLGELYGTKKGKTFINVDVIVFLKSSLKNRKVVIK
ncbi:hypothetical protein [Gemella cuniculi]|uniref:hypothetical protein n=1 Tax=Gemella cuniculi TaxID=150240 RepID=UPI000400E17D|nr:hypothetical protein [Gemella cuniculi]